MGKPAATARPCLRSLSHSFTLEVFVQIPVYELGNIRKQFQPLAHIHMSAHNQSQQCHSQPPAAETWGGHAVAEYVCIALTYGHHFCRRLRIHLAKKQVLGNLN